MHMSSRVRRACALMMIPMTALSPLAACTATPEDPSVSRATRAPVIQEAGRAALPPTAPPASTPVSSPASAGQTVDYQVDCRPGRYSGMYLSTLFGGGPIEFELIAGAPAPSGATPCQEFCADLVTNTEGGDFKVSWFGFEGVGKIKGGLDCRTGQFRAEMVDGKTSIGPLDGGLAELLPSGMITGSLLGRFQVGAVPSIQGTFMTQSVVEAEGTFDVQRQP